MNTTAKQIGEAFEEVVENLSEYEYPYCLYFYSDEPF